MLAADYPRRFVRLALFNAWSAGRVLGVGGAVHWLWHVAVPPALAWRRFDGHSVARDQLQVSRLQNNGSHAGARVPFGRPGTLFRFVSRRTRRQCTISLSTRHGPCCVSVPRPGLGIIEPWLLSPAKRHPPGGEAEEYWGSPRCARLATVRRIHDQSS